MDDLGLETTILWSAVAAIVGATKEKVTCHHGLQVRSLVSKAGKQGEWRCQVHVLRVRLVSESKVVPSGLGSYYL